MRASKKRDIPRHSDRLNVKFIFLNYTFLAVSSMTISTFYTFKCLGALFILVTSFRAFGTGFVVLALTCNMATPYLFYLLFKTLFVLTSIIFILIIIRCTSNILGTFSLISS